MMKTIRILVLSATALVALQACLFQSSENPVPLSDAPAGDSIPTPRLGLAYEKKGGGFVLAEYAHESRHDSVENLFIEAFDAAGMKLWRSENILYAIADSIWETPEGTAVRLFDVPAGPAGSAPPSQTMLVFDGQGKIMRKVFLDRFHPSQSDNSFVMLGDSSDGGVSHFSVSKIGVDGVTRWKTSVCTDTSAFESGLFEIPGKSFVSIVGTRADARPDTVIVSTLGSDGRLKWVRRFGIGWINRAYPDWGRSRAWVQGESDGTLDLAFFSTTEAGKDSLATADTLLVVRMDAEGGTLWSRKYGLNHVLSPGMEPMPFITRMSLQGGALSLEVGLAFAVYIGDGSEQSGSHWEYGMSGWQRWTASESDPSLEAVSIPAPARDDSVQTDCGVFPAFKGPEGKIMAAGFCSDTAGFPSARDIPWNDSISWPLRFQYPAIFLREAAAWKTVPLKQYGDTVWSYLETEYSTGIRTESYGPSFSYLLPTSKGGVLAGGRLYSRNGRPTSRHQHTLAISALELSGDFAPITALKN